MPTSLTDDLIPQVASIICQDAVALDKKRTIIESLGLSAQHILAVEMESEMNMYFRVALEKFRSNTSEATLERVIREMRNLDLNDSADKLKSLRTSNIVSILELNSVGRIIANPDPLVHVLNAMGDCKVKIIALNGPMRTGKSFILSCVLASLDHSDKSWIQNMQENFEDYFESCPGWDPHTKRVDIWKYPLFTEINEEKVGIILLDVQGEFDYKTTRVSEGLIFAFTSLLSSTAFDQELPQPTLFQEEYRNKLTTAIEDLISLFSQTNKESFASYIRSQIGLPGERKTKVFKAGMAEPGLNFAVTYAGIPSIVNLIGNDPVALRNWQNIKHSFVQDAVDLAEIGKCGDLILEPVRKTLELWVARMSSRATLQTLVKILREDCSLTKLADDVTKYADAIRLHQESNLRMMGGMLSLAQNPELHRAAFFGNLQEVCRLLDDGGAAIDARSGHGATALHYAAKEGFVLVVNALLERGAQIEATAMDMNYTPLHCATEFGRIDVVRALISKGANIMAPCSDYSTPICSALRNGFTDITVLLLDNGIGPNDDIYATPSGQRQSHIKPLHLAAAYDSRAVRLLLDRNAVVNSTTTDGETPLHAAAWFGHLEGVRELLRSPNLNLNAQSGAGGTALHIASQLGAYETVRALIRAGASTHLYTSVSEEGLGGRSPLHYAVHFGSENPARVLIEEGGANVNDVTKSIEHYTPLHLSASRDSVPITRLLLEKRAGVNTVAIRNFTPLDVAAQDGRVDMVRILLDKHADVNAPDEEGQFNLTRNIEGKKRIRRQIKSNQRQKIFAMRRNRQKQYRTRTKVATAVLSNTWKPMLIISGGLVAILFVSAIAAISQLNSDKKEEQIEYLINQRDDRDAEIKVLRHEIQNITMEISAFKTQLSQNDELIKQQGQVIHGLKVYIQKLQAEMSAKELEKYIDSRKKYEEMERKYDESWLEKLKGSILFTVKPFEDNPVSNTIVPSIFAYFGYIINK